MATTLRLRWTPLAAEHLEAAHQFIAKDNPAAADEQIELILATIERLETHFFLGREGRVEGTRELVITGTPFIVAYRMKSDQVLILDVLHGARKWPKRFKE